MKYFFLLLLFGCATGPKISLQSEPDKADVYVFSEINRSFENLGKTPLILEADDARLKEFNANNMTVIRVEKEGHAPENILIPGNKLQDVKVMLKLKQNNEWISKDNTSISKVAEEIARGLHQINRETNSRKYSSALERINSLLAKYPETSIFYDIKGSLHLLLSEREEAKRSFKKALELNPSNMKTRKMLENLN